MKNCIREYFTLFRNKPRAFIFTATLHKFELYILWSYEFSYPFKKSRLRKQYNFSLGENRYSCSLNKAYDLLVVSLLENRRAKRLACQSQTITVFIIFCNTKNLDFTTKCFCFVCSVFRALIGCIELLKMNNKMHLRLWM